MTVVDVRTAWSAVMADVQGIGKRERVDSGPARFNFRGVDTVVNAVGPALRAHGVIVVPEAESIELERYQTAKGGQMQGAIVRMRYTVTGPAGDSFTGVTYGQSADAGDKAVTKAQSVAWRVFLLQSLTIPTDEPDPDYEVHERAVAQSDPQRKAMNRLAALVESKGMVPADFAAWASGSLGVDLRSADVQVLADLAARVEAEGAEVMGGGAA